MTAGTVILEAKQLGRRGDAGELLLHDVSLAVYGADRLAIVGPTGSGKTLLLRALALLDPQQSGELLWHARPVSADKVPDYRSHVVYLHQRPALFEGTVLENLQMPFAMQVHRGKSFDRGRVLELLQVMDRDEAFLQKQQLDLSGGESQIVALLRAVQLDPEVLLLDEATAALDAESTAALEKLVSAWMEQKATERATVWVSHDDRQARRLANRRIRLEKGKLHEED